VLVELLPRVGSPRPPVGVLGPGFTLCIVNSGGELSVFLETRYEYWLNSFCLGLIV
jgi:hypothetical protein